MISKDTLGWNFLEGNQKHVRRWRFFVRDFKIEKGVPIIKVRSDHGKEFEKTKIDSSTILNI